ncbi:MAG: type II secretion system protein [Erysipelotrichaceae bacterium]|nr:type II secretion system protein [Erysipelotrichaceae bacterium]MBP5280220.1 type II secretion system protein [Erysipelotrichaceae bacterium]
MSSTEKGFTLIETLLSLMVICGVCLIALSFNPTLNLDHYYYMNEYLETLCKSLVNKETNSYKGGIFFNSMGHVYQGKTIDFGRHQVIVHLGNGYATIK